MPSKCQWCMSYLPNLSGYRGAVFGSDAIEASNKREAHVQTARLRRTRVIWTTSDRVAITQCLFCRESRITPRLVCTGLDEDTGLREQDAYYTLGKKLMGLPGSLHRVHHFECLRIR